MKKRLFMVATLSVAFILSACGGQNRQQWQHDDDNEAKVSAAVSATSADYGRDEESLDQNDPSNAVAHEDPDEEKILLPAPLKGRSEQILRRTGYIVSYNKDLKIPNWVAWHLTADRLKGPGKRKGVEFHPDVEVNGVKVDTYDYMQSGYDRGHMCPAGDNKFSQLAMDESFLMSNICPQIPNLNRGDWNEMEIQCRNWAKEYGDVYIVCGPVFYRQKHKTIGQHQVTVPEAFFKCVLCLSGGKPWAVGFLYRNVTGNHPKSYYVNSVDEVERVTGMDFFHGLEKKIQDRVEKEAVLPE